MTERWTPTLGETLPSDTRFLGLVDDVEGFRVLLQDKTAFVYGLYADVVFYQHYPEIGPSRPVGTPSQALMFEVKGSALIEEVRRTGNLSPVPLSHFALCFKHDRRIDIVCRGAPEVRAAGAKE